MVSTSRASDDCRRFICSPKLDNFGLFDRNGAELFDKMTPWSTLPAIRLTFQRCTSCWMSSVS
jgi:hypothetical protein